MTVRKWFRIGDIQARTAYGGCIQGADEGIGIDDLTTGHIDQTRPVVHRLELRIAKEVVGIRGEGDGDHDVVSCAQSSV